MALSGYIDLVLVTDITTEFEIAVSKDETVVFTPSPENRRRNRITGKIFQPLQIITGGTMVKTNSNWDTATILQTVNVSDKPPGGQNILKEMRMDYVITSPWTPKPRHGHFMLTYSEIPPDEFVGDRLGVVGVPTEPLDWMLPDLFFTRNCVNAGEILHFINCDANYRIRKPDGSIIYQHSGSNFYTCATVGLYKFEFFATLDPQLIPYPDTPVIPSTFTSSVESSVTGPITSKSGIRTPYWIGVTGKRYPPGGGPPELPPTNAILTPISNIGVLVFTEVTEFFASGADGAACTGLGGDSVILTMTDAVILPSSIDVTVAYQVADRDYAELHGIDISVGT